jgi:glycosyltransferase involved in cell wall biosynthesis
MQEIEIIIINDGSAVNYRSRLDEYARKDRRIRAIHQENLGIAAARNAGIKLARGTYIMFVDADDWLERDICEYAVEEAKKRNAEILLFSARRKLNGKTSELILGHNRWIEQENFEELKLHILRLDGYYSYGKKYNFRIISAISKIYLRSIFENSSLMFDARLSLCEDGVLFLHQLDVVERVFYYARLGYNIRTNSESFTHQYNKNMEKIILSTIERFDDYINQHNCDPVYLKAVGIGTIRLVRYYKNLYLLHNRNNESYKTKIYELSRLLSNGIVAKNLRYVSFLSAYRNYRGLEFIEALAIKYKKTRLYIILSYAYQKYKGAFRNKSL